MLFEEWDVILCTVSAYRCTHTHKKKNQISEIAVLHKMHVDTEV